MKLPTDQSTTRLAFKDETIPLIPAELEAFRGLVDLSFQGCSVGGVDPRALKAGGAGGVRVTFESGQTDFASIAATLLEHGAGNWKFELSSSDDQKKWHKDFDALDRLGDAFLDERALRECALRIASPRTKLTVPKVPAAPSRHHLRLLSLGDKKLRTASQAYLESWPNPVAQLPAGARWFLVGKPTQLDRATLEARIAASGGAVAKKLADATHVVVLDRPGDVALRPVLAGDLPVLLERQLCALLPAPAVADPVAPEEIAARLVDADPARVTPVLAQLELSAESATAHRTTLLALSRFHGDNEIRRHAQRVLSLSKDAALVRYVAENASKGPGWGIEGQARLVKLDGVIQQMARLGADSDELTRTLLFLARDPFALEAALRVAMVHTRDRERPYEGLREVTSLSFTGYDKPWPFALRSAPALEALEFRHSTLTGYDGHLGWLKRLRSLTLICTRFEVRALADAAGITRLTLSHFQADSLSSLASMEGVQELELRLHADTPAPADLGFLGGLRKLRRLHLAGAHFTSLAGVSAFSGLERVRLEQTAVTDLEPLAELTALREVVLSRGMSDAQINVLTRRRPDITVHLGA